MNDQQAPSLLLVIFDALRASDFPGGETPTERMPFTTQLLSDSIHFPKAASVTPWTIPAHASAFTGLYPWESGCHAKKSLVLADSVPKLPAALRSKGYRSLLLSANTLVCPRFGLADGFDDAGWGGWWESYIRRGRVDSAPSTLHEAKQEAKILERFRDGPIGRLVINSTEAIYRYPYLFDAADALHQKVRWGDTARNISMAPWIEPSLSAWLSRQPRGTPVFCAINICDTHEPYFVPDGFDKGLRKWWKQARVRQDFVRCILGSWQPTGEELRILRTLYRSTVQNIDQRLARIVEIFRQAGRWDNTVLIATSDHGQAFGEHGELFHLNGIIDPMLRIPMVYRPVGGTGRTTRGQGWASLIDIAPTFLREAQINGINLPSALPLQDLVDRPRPTPVFAVSDGLVWSHLKKVVPESRKPEFDRVRVVAYSGGLKLVVDTTRPERQAYDLEQDPGEVHDVWEDVRDSLAPVADAAVNIGRRMTEKVPEELTPEIEERLRGWGYV
ncbi:MAG TPA: sulfatase-like hydrolase/transferase [Thermoplasmata archaeon]